MLEAIVEQDGIFEKFGYNLKRHKVTTKDGYILSLLRVSKTFQIHLDLNKVIEKSTKPAVLLVHGMTCSGEMWLLNEDQSLRNKSVFYIHTNKACLLVEEGYDCWITTFRGAGLSKDHVFLDTSSKKYWDFSYHEIGLFDIRAVIDFILNTTGNTRLYYVGHSLGCAVLYILLSQKPKYCTKIETMVAIAPAVYCSHLRNKLVRHLITPITIIMGKMRYLYRRPTAAHSIAETVNKISPSCLNQNRLTYWIMKNIGSRMGVYRKEQITKEVCLNLAAHSPASTSIKLVSHLSQAIYTGKFQPYDHGRSTNMQKYGQNAVQPYDLNKVQIPVATIFSLSDQISDARDVIYGVNKLPDPIELHLVTESILGHLDLMLSKDAPKVVYSKVIEILKRRKDSFPESQI